MKILVVVDMQNDFIGMALGSKDAQKIAPNVVEKAKNYDGEILFTLDTHFDDYMSTQEGRNLPVIHCVKNTVGWELIDGLKEISSRDNCRVFEKENSFGSVDMCKYIVNNRENIDRIDICGVCTDICVVTNALMLKASVPEIPIYVDERCCAGLTPEKHSSALDVMRSCQIYVE